VLFHTNSNTSGDNAALNNSAKRRLTLNMLAANAMGLPANTLITGELERANYSGSFLGFVYVLKEGNDWKSYCDGIIAASHAIATPNVCALDQCISGMK